MRFYWPKIILAAVEMLVYACVTTAHAQNAPVPPGHTRSLSVPKTDKAPAIDGKLDEEVWKKAAVADGFWISEQKRWPAEKTEVLVIADKDHLYLAFRAYDSQPDKIEARQGRRDAGLGLDDQVGVELDPFHNHREISTYLVNAIGTQDDAIAGGRARNIQWKGDWRVAVARTDYGWSAEFAIPFEILNYREADTTFGINFLRYHNRTDEWSRWADVTPQNKPEEMGQITGLELPVGVKTYEWTFMPYVLAGHNTPDKEGKIHHFLGTGGIDTRYQPRQNLTGVLSFNPDFSQLETQITDINFNYNEKFRTDPRPFFQEGSSYFGSNSTFLYSNRVPNFDYGGKVFAQWGRNKIGALVTEAPDSRWDMVFRLAHELDATNTVSVMVVGTDRKDLKNQLIVGQFGGRQPNGFNYGLDMAMTETQRRDGDGEYIRGAVGWKGDYAYVGTAYDQYGTDFFPANGLVNQDLLGTRGTNPYAGYYREFAGGPFRVLSGDAGWIGRRTMEGLTQNNTWYANASVELHQRIALRLYHSDGFYRPVAGAPGQWSDDMNHDRYWSAGVDFNTRSSFLGFGASYSWGELGGGEYGYLAPYFWIRPTKETFLKVTTERLHSFGTFDQTIVSGGWDITPQDSFSFRYIAAEGDDYVRLAYSRQVRKGINLFAVYNKAPMTPEQFSVKLVFALPFSFASLFQSNSSSGGPTLSPSLSPVPVPASSQTPDIDKKPPEIKAPNSSLKAQHSNLSGTNLENPNSELFTSALDTRDTEQFEPSLETATSHLKTESSKLSDSHLEPCDSKLVIRHSQPFWSVQVKSFSQKADSLNLVEVLRNKGYDSYAVEAHVSGPTWYHVRVGHLAAKQDAEALRKLLKSKEGFSDAFLVAQGKTAGRTPRLPNNE